MNGLYRTFFLAGVLLLTVFAKMDINSEYSVPIAAFSVCATDLDNDGDNDLIIGHRTPWQSNSPTITIMNNYNGGAFQVSDTTRCFCGYQENVFTIDVDKNSYPDIITLSADFSNVNPVHNVRVFYNSNGTLSYYKDFNLNSSSTFDNITYGDVDGDGFPDIIIASNIGQLFGVLYNDGNGNFSIPGYQHLTNTYPTGIACGDLNNDGRDDIIVFGSKVEVFYSHTTGFEQNLLCEQKTNGWVVDLNHDGLKDIIAFADLLQIGVTAVTLFENTGSGTFIKSDEKLFNFSTSDIYMSDFNNDSLPDILFKLSDMSGHVIYFNKGGFHFSDSTFVAINYYNEPWRKCCCADLDGNGYNDIVTVRTSYIKLPSNIDIKFNDGKNHFIDHPLGINDEIKFHESGSLINCPNPFSDQTTISFSLNKTCQVRLSIFNSRGDFIATLIEQKMNPGLHSLTWNRRGGDGNKCPTGLYFAILQTNGSKFHSIKLLTY